ncbi:histidine phosphatase superfamily [Podospora aff. communis PSN243]|uniref:Histidine phosphatase superfamily n=1 Tax=Podospora aff. communis PSN243 TaxID=3040156 RepID=A0AAV9H1W2_9PEZI|nr:histidine phosphatase superfamily [Podospora aff. communis PSN243]
MTIYIHLVRHAQGFHNLSAANHQLPDPDLTPLGEQQCATLRDAFPHHKSITYLVASPMRRTIYTCLLSFAPAVDSGVKVIALPEVQEVSNLPCDTGTDPARLQSEFGPGGKVDLSLVVEGWNDKSFDTKWAPEMQKLDARAKAARVWLRDLGRKGVQEVGGDGDVHIAVVTHGGFLHFLTDDFDGLNAEMGTGWVNTELRTYQFVDPEGSDGEAKLKETGDSWRRRRGSAVGLTETEQMEIRIALKSRLKEEFGGV